MAIKNESRHEHESRHGKAFVSVRVLREKKDDTLRFRASIRQKEYWVNALKELGVDDFSSYARFAIDRAVSQDLLSKDPKWQEFIREIQPIAKKLLGYEIQDNLSLRTKNLAEFMDAAWKQHK